MKSPFIIGFLAILMTTSLPMRSETKKISLLNLNQPYQDQWEKDGDKRIPFKTVEDNNRLWKDVIKSRNKVAGYYDTEFANRINYCRYIGESVVLQNKGKFILENVLKYLLRCNHTQQQIISHYLKRIIKMTQIYSNFLLLMEKKTS